MNSGATTATAIDLMRNEYSASKLRWGLVLLVQLVGVVVAVLGTGLRGPWVAVPAACTLAIPIASTLLKHWATRYQARGDDLRRSLVLADGLGRTVDAEPILIGAAEGTEVASWDPAPIGSYFNSPMPAGPGRVVHIVQQSAFFSTRHAAAAALLCFLFAGTSTSLGVALLWLFVHAALAMTSATVASAASALLAFGVGGEFLAVGLSFWRLQDAARATVRACGSLLRTSTIDQSQLLAVTGGYDSAIGQAPPVPGFLYRIQRRRLEKAWRLTDPQRPATTAPGVPQPSLPRMTAPNEGR
ncbi:MAG TPA: hypothetical protein VH062_00515 [Polyangiaceae bacterium]|jgi:hypothetical protein|nr:hypothetical protein [Polyangiaceae bacterium]